MRDKGVTLIELLVVLFIIGAAFALVGVTFFRSKEDIDLKTFTREVSASLRYARIRAVAEKKIYAFVISKDEKICVLYSENITGENDDDLWKKISSKKIPEGIELEDSEDNKKQDILRIDFSPEGGSTGGEIKFKNLKGSVIQIIIEQITGRVTIQKAQS